MPQALENLILQAKPAPAQTTTAAPGAVAPGEGGTVAESRDAALAQTARVTIDNAKIRGSPC